MDGGGPGRGRQGAPVALDVRTQGPEVTGYPNCEQFTMIHCTRDFALWSGMPLIALWLTLNRTTTFPKFLSLQTY